MDTIYMFQLLTCAMMTSLIWVIQILHYPTFHYVADDRFEKFHEFHSRNITFIVLPTMCVELATAFATLTTSPRSIALELNSIGVTLIWLITFFISVPLHNRLAKHRDPKLIDRLIRTNWLRTALWSGRLFVLVAHAFAVGN